MSIISIKLQGSRKKGIEFIVKTFPQRKLQAHIEFKKEIIPVLDKVPEN